MEQFWHEPRRSGMLMSVVAVQPDKLSVRPYTTLYQQTTDSVLSQLFALLFYPLVSARHFDRKLTEHWYNPG